MDREAKKKKQNTFDIHISITTSGKNTVSLQGGRSSDRLVIQELLYVIAKLQFNHRNKTVPAMVEIPSVIPMESSICVPCRTKTERKKKKKEVTHLMRCQNINKKATWTGTHS